MTTTATPRYFSAAANTLDRLLTIARAARKLATTRNRLLAENAQLKNALELGQENCDAEYERLREERDEAQQARERLYKAMCGKEREEFNAALMAFAPEEAGDHFLVSAKRMVERAAAAQAELAALREELDRQRSYWQRMLPDALAHKAITKIDAARKEVRS